MPGEDRFLDMLYAEIKECRKDIAELRTDVSSLKTEMKFKSGLWGALAGAIPSMIALTLLWFK